GLFDHAVRQLDSPACRLDRPHGFIGKSRLVELVGQEHDRQSTRRKKLNLSQHEGWQISANLWPKVDRLSLLLLLPAQFLQQREISFDTHYERVIVPAQPDSQIVADESRIRREQRLPWPAPQHLIQMASFAVGSRSQTHVPREPGPHMLQGRLEDLRAGF